MTAASTKRRAIGLAATAALGLGPLAAGSAGADPAQFGALVGVGSDTTQDVMNAMSGRSNGLLYTPLQSSAATGRRQVISFDATPPAGVADNCITTKLGAPSFTRPNGSTQGRRALSRAIDGTGYGEASCGGPTDIGGLVEYARSSSPPASGDTGTALTYIPFGRDGIGFAYYRAGGSPVTSLTRAQLTSLFTTGPQVIDGVNIIPCGIQTGSGTFQFWNTVTTATTAQENAATATCQNLATGFTRLQENDGVELKAKGDAAPAGSQVVVGFSAGAFIAKSNGVATPTPPSAVGMGSISNNGAGANLGSPVTGSAPNLAPNATYYADSTFGRRVFNVFPSSIITGIGNNDLKDLFVGSGSKICQATAIVNTFGFLVAPDCGSTTIKGSLLSGQL